MMLQACGRSGHHPLSLSHLTPSRSLKVVRARPQSRLNERRPALSIGRFTRVRACSSSHIKNAEKQDEEQHKIFLLEGKCYLISQIWLDHLENGKPIDMRKTDLDAGWIGQINSWIYFDEAARIVAKRRGVAVESLSDAEGYCFDVEVAHEVMKAKVSDELKLLYKYHVLRMPYSFYLHISGKNTF